MSNLQGRDETLSMNLKMIEFTYNKSKTEMLMVKF